jgi:hypothetical protein
MTEEEVLAARGEMGLKIHRRQRRKSGWSVYDAWSADGHILRIIGEIALYYREHKAGYPVGISEDEWNDILTRIGEPLIDYANRQFEAQFDDPMWEKATKALKLFAKWHAHFWD